MYSSIDVIQLGDAPWKCFTVSYTGEVQANDPSWKSAKYEVWFRDPEVIMTQILDNPLWPVRLCALYWSRQIWETVLESLHIWQLCMVS